MPTSEEQVRLVLYVPKALRDKLTAAAKLRDRSVSSLARIWLAEKLAQSNGSTETH